MVSTLTAATQRTPDENRRELTAGQRRRAEQIVWATVFLACAEIAAVIILAGLGPWVAVAALLVFGQINRLLRPSFERMSAEIYLLSWLGLMLGLGAAIVVLALD